MKPYPMPMSSITRPLVAGLLFMLTHAVGHAATPYERFFGHYQGTSTSVPEGESQKRSISVSIGAGPRRVSWLSGTQRYRRKADVAHRKSHRSHSSLLNAGTSTSQPRAGDVFGHAATMNPLKGDPFIWAVTTADTLTIYILQVTKSGEQDLRIYKRVAHSSGYGVRANSLPRFRANHAYPRHATTCRCQSTDTPRTPRSSATRSLVQQAR